MALVKESTSIASQNGNLTGVTMPYGDVQAVREDRAVKGSFEGELFAQIPMMPPVLLSPTGIRLPAEKTKDEGLTVRVVGAPITSFTSNPSFPFDFAMEQASLNSRVGSLIGEAEAIVGVKQLPQMIDELIHLSRERGEKLKDVRIIAHAREDGSLYMGDEVYNVNDDPEVARQFSRLASYLVEDAHISFHGCLLGQAGLGLQNIADATKATVKASLDYQKSDKPGLQGRVVTFTPR